MTSTSPHHLIDDDDEFDWEAAVREIDVACQSTNPTISSPNARTNNSVSSSRQSTLDRFIQKAGPSVRSEDRIDREIDQDRVEEIDLDKFQGSGRVSYVEIDAEAAKTWIYPANVPLREYQQSISRTALFSNTLVALPTGLGKTLIAAVVMYNYFRWFPEGKIVFAAPSRPLVLQQIEACHNIVGIPQEWTIDLTGQTSPTKRACFWKVKRVFFVTPQVLERDIQSGTFAVKYLVCLVIDEAHRATGNYSYCVAVRELMAVPVELRILALTATPGSKHQTIQNIIDNLQISTLEYRNESDPDVSPYVHDRKVELIEVAMAEVAVEINNRLLEVIRPLFARLCALGVLQNRDMQTLSPMELLNARDRFRQAPPLDLPQLKHGEVEGYLGVLITLYHIRKLLSSHGVRPAYDMIEDKLRQGYFARLMTRNEVLQKLKLLMEQSLSHGAPDPKLSKMLEVLTDHFKMSDPKNSRVIIFSNFRGSVRDIMNALMTIGDFVKATQFVGQSSGKTLKGQSQKVQQAVLEKFRAGGYNVIVATSIGEEGLDIMEVDLVICFDANISPLRMIQRMGRTGRKHDGRVVVLAFQGTELKGYLRKQANNKSINKHMRNGGMNSFNFHSSPRMIPHIFKPEVVSIELSIEQFIPRGKKGKVDDASQTPVFNAKLSDAETDLVAKYFDSTKESIWRPSLISFPHFQASPSRVLKVLHSSRTEMLIDAMQHLQGLAIIRDNSTILVEDEALSNLHLGVETIEQHEHSKEDEVNARIKDFSDRTTSSWSRRNENKNMPTSKCSSVAQQENAVDVDDKILQTPVSKMNSSNEGEYVILETPQERKRKVQLIDDSSNGLRDFELSPRLSNFIKAGVVPESPIDYAGTSKGKGVGDSMDPNSCSPAKSNNKEFPMSSIPEKEEKMVLDSSACGRNVLASVTEEIHTPLPNSKCESTRGSISAIRIVEDVKTPLANSTTNSCSKDWCLDSGSKSESIKQEKKFKRLRKYGEQGKQRPLDGDIGPNRKPTRACGSPRPILVKNDRGKRKPVKDVRDFIEEEAEVSSEVEVSDDEEVEPDTNSYDDSFIDDRINPTQASTQPETSGTDMMAIYRHSLLTQSPMERVPNGCTDFSPTSVASKTRMSDSGSSSGTVNRSLQTPQTGSQSVARISNSFLLKSKQIATEEKPCTTDGIPRENESRIGGLKRKLSFYPVGSVPAINLDQVFLSHSVAACRETSVQDQVQKSQPNGDIFDDDQFYEGLDLDAVEEEAAKLLGYKSELPVNKKVVIPDPNPLPLRVMGSPTFDLGI
ncbi:DEAD-box ATP-dependent RNA helicase FANCM isoform X2 [Rhododendron vialii]|uniref:DEAD-box ATP-dependent RNA helicase FANCM isoform X2 n=1 Tax=Rhododendron vialii TaxID=182163 RepID=UPI0026601913|nr:DEAD-box ATP-dependent RNA helicase FANCM isoform X2 [Rhododendron vialii]